MGFSHISGPGIGGLLTTTRYIESPADTDVLKWKTPCAGTILKLSASIKGGTSISASVATPDGEVANLPVVPTGIATTGLSNSTFDSGDTITVTLSNATGTPKGLNVFITWKSTGDTAVEGS